MKIFLIFTFYLISGPVNCSDVIGYLGGSVIITTNINWYADDTKYICMVDGNDCRDVIRVATKQIKVQYGRFMLYSNLNNFLVLITKLKPQDAATYRFGLGDQSNSAVNLKVYNNTQCQVPKILNAYLGQNFTVTCNYPGEYERNMKYLLTLNDDSFVQEILHTNASAHNGRFSISDDTSVKVLSVNFSNVGESDEAFYLFGVWNGDAAVKYYTFFSVLWLQVTATASTSTPASALCISSPFFITTCVCLALLLIGGFALMIYKLRRKSTQVTDNTPSYENTDNKLVTTDRTTNSDLIYENFSLSSIYSNTQTIS